MGGTHPRKRPDAFPRSGACQVPHRRPQPELPRGLRSGPLGGEGTGRGAPLYTRKDAVRSGLLVGVFFTPTGCLTASAGGGAEPRGFNLATEAN